MPDSAALGTPAPVVALLRELLGEVDRLCQELSDRILETQAGYRASSLEADALRGALRGNLVRTLRRLMDDGSASEQPDEARATGAARARQGVPLAEVLNAYRLGGEVLWQELVGLHDRQGEHHLRDLLQSAHLFWRVIDLESKGVVAGYSEQEEWLRRQDDRRQQATVDGLLSGRGAEPGFAREASLLLGLPHDGPLLVAVLLPVDDSETATTTEPRSSLGATWTVRGGVEVGLAPADPSFADRLRAATLADPHRRIGLSPVVSGFADLPRGHRLAETAARLARRGEVVELADRLPEALLAGQPDLQQLLRERTTACLNTLPAADRQLLLSTLRALVATHWSATSAAALVHCHRNTVMYRLGVVEKHHGQRIESADARLLWTLGLLLGSE